MLSAANLVEATHMYALPYLFVFYFVNIRLIFTAHINSDQLYANGYIADSLNKQRNAGTGNATTHENTLNFGHSG